MALFGKKKGGEGDGGDDQQPDAATFTPKPDKAERFFGHARTVHDSTNFEYAMTLWLQGLRFDPASLNAVEAFFRSAASFLNTNDKAKGPTRDQLKALKDSGSNSSANVEKLLLNLLHWGTKPTTDWQAGLKAMVAAAELEIDETAYWLGERVLNMAAADPKAKKEHFVILMNTFARVGGYDKATLAGEKAAELDPRDAKLIAEVKNMSAQAAMSRGGFDQPGEQGGFRRNIKDVEAQRQLGEQDAVVKSEATLDRQIELAIADHKSRPEDTNTAQRLGKLLLERGRPDDEKAAVAIYTKAHQHSDSYRFKMLADDVKIRIGRRKLRALQHAAKEQPDDQAAAAKAKKGQRELIEFETKSYQERVENYPTDLKLRYQLGARLLELHRFDDAIEQFQLSQEDPGVAVPSMMNLGRCFAEVGWLDEAEGTYRRAIDHHHSDNDDTGLALRYGLMTTLQSKAEQERELEPAEEAFRLASGIAIKQIGFKDIRDRRTTIQQLIRDIKASA